MNFQTLYEAHKNKVYNLALQYVQNKEEAEEITQDVFMVIYKKMDAFRHEAEVSTWIYRITINKSIDHLRTRQRKQKLVSLLQVIGIRPDEMDPPDFDHPGVKLEQKERMQEIFKAINALPERQKTVLLLNKIEKVPLSEIALIMDLSPKAVESLLMRAKAGLENKLKENEGI